MAVEHQLITRLKLSYIYTKLVDWAPHEVPLWQVSLKHWITLDCLLNVESDNATQALTRLLD